MIASAAHASGTAVLPLLRVGQGTRAAALGESYVGRADDASALYWNPAGLGRVTRYHLSLSHHEWFAGIRDELLHATLPGRAGAFGVGLLYSTESGIEYRTPENTPLDTFRTWSSVMSVGYGARFAERFRLGVGLKGFYNSLHTTAGYGGAADIGLGMRQFDAFEFGLVARNLGLARYGLRWHELPAVLSLGACWTPGGRPASRLDGLSLSADLTRPLTGPLSLQAGVEYRPADVLALRLGYRTGPVDLAGLGWHAGLTGGFGLTLGPVALDYAIAPHGTLGLVHRVGLDLSRERRGAGRLIIRTTDADGHEPLTANLAFDGVHRGTARTDRLGRYELTGLLPGRLIIRTSLPGRVPRADTMHILGDRRQSATIALEPAKHGSIWVALYDATTMQALEGTVSYSGPVYGEQEVPGTTVIRELPAGEYSLRAQVPGYGPATCSVRVEPVTTIEQRLLLERKR